MISISDKGIKQAEEFRKKKGSFKNYLEKKGKLNFSEKEKQQYQENIKEVRVLRKIKHFEDGKQKTTE